ncbi:DinB family protein [Caulobacter sp. 17J80-11]|uniref:DinB family protein n=1 Tax=Caulobacter sp. 17J80-11 TaxID=2763502 RepID=UPI0016535605|nr:DinB family protein [Caulobacter sp. 17J80-11]MBC6980976.1 damage-inducible protein DinB [Caulobacter sp. 17J80-11]
MTLDRYRMFAAYNAWANGRIYDACASLPEAAYKADRNAFFGSLHGTLTHVLVADRIWMRRLTGEGPSYDRLDVELADDLATLQAMRLIEDARIRAYVDAIDPAALDEPYGYANMSGVALEQTLSSALDHVFNHQTHHRGQAHGLLSLAGVEPPALDLVYFQREAGITRTV